MSQFSDLFRGAALQSSGLDTRLYFFFFHLDATAPRCLLPFYSFLVSIHWITIESVVNMVQFVSFLVGIFFDREHEQLRELPSLFFVGVYIRFILSK